MDTLTIQQYTLFQNDNILNINIIAIQEPWENIRDIRTYHLQNDIFYLLYSKINKARICYFINKKIGQFTWTYIINGLDIVNLYFSLLDRNIHIHNIYKEVRTRIFILKTKLATYPNKEYIILEDFNLYYEA